MSRNCCLSFTNARRRRGYQTNGTETLRPSTKSTTKASSVSCAATARNDDSSITKVVIPRFPELLSIFCDILWMSQEFRSPETKRFHLQPGPQPLVFRSRGINDDVAVDKPHSSRPGNGRSCRILRCHRAGSGMLLIPPRDAMRRSGSSVFTAWPVSPETDIKVAVTFTFPRRISGGTGR
jgi:hypothetical protein